MGNILGLLMLGVIYGIGYLLGQYGDRLCVFIVKHTGGTDV